MSYAEKKLGTLPETTDNKWPSDQLTKRKKRLKKNNLMPYYDSSFLIVRLLKSLNGTSVYLSLTSHSFLSNQTIADVKKMIYFLNSIELLSTRNKISSQISVWCIQMLVISKAFIILVVYVVQCDVIAIQKNRPL